MSGRQRKKRGGHSAEAGSTEQFEASNGVIGPRALKMQSIMNTPLMIAAALTVPGIFLSETTETGGMAVLATVLNWGTWLTFAINLLLMLALVPDRAKYLRHHPIDLIVVVLTPPVLPASLQALRVLRLLKLLRLLELEKLSRTVFSRQGLAYAGLMTLVIALSGGTLFRAFEARNQEIGEWESIYWAITTMTTLGSQFETTTVGSEIVAVTILLTGVTFISMLTGAIAQRFLSPPDSADEKPTTEADTG